MKKKQNKNVYTHTHHETEMKIMKTHCRTLLFIKPLNIQYKKIYIFIQQYITNSISLGFYLDVVDDTILIANGKRIYVSTNI